MWEGGVNETYILTKTEIGNRRTTEIHFYKNTTKCFVCIFTYGRTVEVQSRQLSYLFLFIQLTSRLPCGPLMVRQAHKAANLHM
jgi:hypothetical protein